jgi:hypothetical protein
MEMAGRPPLPRLLAACLQISTHARVSPWLLVGDSDSDSHVPQFLSLLKGIDRRMAGRRHCLQVLIQSPPEREEAIVTCEEAFQCHQQRREL